MIARVDDERQKPGEYDVLPLRTDGVVRCFASTEYLSILQI